MSVQARVRAPRLRAWTTVNGPVTPNWGLIAALALDLALWVLLFRLMGVLPWIEAPPVRLF
jgi:hypothetical protein